MAIKIPSKNIYNTKNPKVIDNVIERIEVGAVEVVPNNEYETTVYNKNFIVSKDIITDEEIKNTEANGMVRGASAEGMTRVYYSASYVGYLGQKTINISVKIPILLINKYVDTILTKTDANGNENINYSLFGVEEKGSAWAEWDYETASPANIIIKEGSITYASPDTVSEEKRLEIPDNISIYERSNPTVVSSSAEQNLKTWGNVKTAEARKEIVDGEECFVIDLHLMGGVRIVKMTYYITDDKAPAQFSFEGDYTLFNATAVEIGIRGNIIGIDLEDNTLYIPKTDKTSKKVYSLDGNELAQTTNYIYTNNQQEIEFTEGDVVDGLTNYYVQYKDGNPRDYSTVVNFILKKQNNRERTATIPKGEVRTLAIKYISDRLDDFNLKSSVAKINQIETFTEKIIDEYKKGKETATIRCSISDYYDYNNQSKVIAVDNSANKMTFAIGDEVIPMVFGANGKDKPMSLDKDGNAKVFKVLGAKKYYDGAVWQELQLQEA